jgi:hypothetical protein
MKRSWRSVASSYMLFKFLFLSFQSIYTWPISFKFISCYIFFSIVALIFIDKLVVYNIVE